MSEESAYNTSKAASGELVYSLLGGSALKYAGHSSFICKASLTARRAKMHVEQEELASKKEHEFGQERNRIHRTTRNGAWLSAVPHRIKGTEFSQEEFRDNLSLRYGLVPQDIPTTCNGCGNKFSVYQALSCPKGGLVLARNDDAAKEWGDLGAQSLVPSAIIYKPKINSRTVQGEGTGPECGRKEEEPMAAQILWGRPNGVGDQ